ncbi:MAG TPA: flagellar basal body P-ring protein FlgI [Phycisphaerae bacterium]|nr:flagellar basal body P-ring protein FlgI [Phycisphaerae bacterium]
MVRKGPLLALLGAWLLLAGGCSDAGNGADSPSRVVIPPHVAGTVGEYAIYNSGAPLPVQGYGLVVGLGTNGSREVPAHLKEYMVKYLARQGLGSAHLGLSHLTPLRVLQDQDTAIVLLGSAIPFGAPVGARFDLNLTALPNTQTRSLQGGFLMPTELRFAWLGRSMPGGPTKMLAEGGGAIFVNPFVDPNNDAELVKWREGRVLGGGRVASAHPVRVQLRRPDYARADLIRRRINETFPGRTKVANARDRATLELTVPSKWRDDYEHFLRLVMRIPLVSGARLESYARRTILAMEMPGVAHDELGLVLEATGRNVVPQLKRLYTSRNRAAAFYAARTGARLGDRTAEEVLIRFASERSSLQVPAIEELGRHPDLRAASGALQALLDDENSRVRIAAYEALMRRGGASVITRVELDNGLKLDLIKSRRSYVIYATQSMEPRIALFGGDMMVSHPIYFSTADELVTVQSRAKDTKLRVFRKLPNGRFSDALECDFAAKALITQLASRPNRDEDGNMQGLGLTYGQMLSVLYRMCQSGDIRAKFSLQPAPVMSRIRRGSAGVGRADVPGE